MVENVVAYFSPGNQPRHVIIRAYYDIYTQKGHIEDHRLDEGEVGKPEVHGWAVQQAAAEYGFHARLVARRHLQLCIVLPVHRLRQGGRCFLIMQFDLAPIRRGWGSRTRLDPVPQSQGSGLRHASKPCHTVTRLPCDLDPASHHRFKGYDVRPRPCALCSTWAVTRLSGPSTTLYCAVRRTFKTVGCLHGQLSPTGFRADDLSVPIVARGSSGCHLKDCPNVYHLRLIQISLF